MIDAHCHVQCIEEVRYLRKHGIVALVNCQTLAEFEMLEDTQSDQLFLSAGIHPWDADTVSWATMQTVLNKVSIVGEIGLDSVWSSSKMAKQRVVFKQQLHYAASVKKPVILHTKGMEEEVLETIKRYPNTYLVHWYSCEAYLSSYIKLDCYFTLGASYQSDPNVHRVLESVPLNRILIESDGQSALNWAFSREVDWNDYLHKTVRYVADFYGLSLVDIKEVLLDNLRAFSQGR